MKERLIALVVWALLLVAAWLSTAFVLILFADGCGLEHVLPWYDASYNNCNKGVPGN